MTQTITMRETNEVYRIQDMVYPHMELGVVYIRVVVVDNHDSPTHFMIVPPENILYRLQTYDQKDMDEIVTMSEMAMENHIERMKKVEEEEDVGEDDSTEHDRFYG